MNQYHLINLQSNHYLIINFINLLIFNSIYLNHLIDYSTILPHYLFINLKYSKLNLIINFNYYFIYFHFIFFHHYYFIIQILFNY